MFPRVALPLLTRSRGAVVNLVSVGAVAAIPVLPAYSISKAAALSLTQSLRALLAGKGVSVYAVLPGPIDTDVVRHLELPKTPPEDVARAMLHGVERGDAGIFPDSMSQLLAEGWRVGVAKTLEHPERGAGNGRGDRGLSEETAPMRATMTTHAIVSRDEWQAAGAPCLSGRRHTPGWVTSWRDSDGRFPGYGSTRSTRCERPPDRKLLLMPATARARAAF